jgi:hypothetical protein
LNTMGEKANTYGKTSVVEVDLGSELERDVTLEDEFVGGELLDDEGSGRSGESVSGGFSDVGERLVVGLVVAVVKAVVVGYVMVPESVYVYVDVDVDVAFFVVNDVGVVIC